MTEQERIICNACASESWNTTANKKIVDKLNDEFDTQTIICYGKIRRMVFEKITDNHYKVFTVSA